MSDRSKTGLLASPTKSIFRTTKMKKPIHLKALTAPAPYLLRPYAGLYNPYPYGCSLLCNHPTDKEAKDVLRKARETWAKENKNIILPEELQAIRDNLAHMEERKPTQIDSVPEELFRRYTETDSRPLTPAPTLASVKTRGSGSRRCVTPDAITTSVLQERTLLILDLRRSHSQEIISWQGANDPPVINILQAPTPSPSLESPSETPDTCSAKTSQKSHKSAVTKPSPKQFHKLEVPKMPEKPQSKETEQVKTIITEAQIDASDGEEEIIKRRGKRRKKRGRDSSRGPLAVQASIDPETQIATLGPDSHNPSSRPSLVNVGSIQDLTNISQTQLLPDRKTRSAQNPNMTKSFLGPEMLKHLQRELTNEVIDLEFDKMKRAALEEAYKTLPTERKAPCNEMKQLQKELDLSAINAELWLSLPRVFSRSSARFELPLHSRLLNDLDPLTYLSQHCAVSGGRRLLYNLVFNRHRDFNLKDNVRLMQNKEIATALGEMMGKPFTDDQLRIFHELVGWEQDGYINFQTWCGMCAFCERLFASEFCPQTPSKEIDPCNDVEIADFESLPKRLQEVSPDERLVKILYAIKDL